MNRKLGGAEQAFVDYYSALILKGHDVVNILLRPLNIKLTLEK